MILKVYRPMNRKYWILLLIISLPYLNDTHTYLFSELHECNWEIISFPHYQ